MITVYVKKISDITDGEKQSIMASLSHPALERLNKKRNEDLYLASLCALSLLSEIQRQNLAYNENGCPFFKDIDADISISHSKTHVAVAISNSNSTPVGVDIEDFACSTDEPIGYPPINTRFLTENEKKNTANTTKYIETWTKKEALYKFLKNDPTPFFHLDSTFSEKYGAQFSTTQIENSILTVCAPKNEKIEIIRK